MKSFAASAGSLDNYRVPAVINWGSIRLVPQAEIMELQQKLDEVKSDLAALNSVYRMNRDYIDFVKSKLANPAFVTEQDIVDYRNSIARGKK